MFFTWRKELIEVLLEERDDELIYATPLSPNEGRDCIIWHYTPTGIITISSAYTVSLQHHKSVPKRIFLHLLLIRDGQASYGFVLYDEVDVLLLARVRRLSNLNPSIVVYVELMTI